MEQTVTNNWRKSSFSGGAGAGNCVELGEAPGAILVRDTTDREGFTMSVSPAAWRTALAQVKTGNLPV